MQEEEGHSLRASDLFAEGLGGLAYIEHGMHSARIRYRVQRLAAV